MTCAYVVRVAGQLQPLFKMAVISLKLSLPSLPDEFHHFEFPKRTFGKSKSVLCSTHSQRINSCPFLHYDELCCDVHKVPFQQTGSTKSAWLVKFLAVVVKHQMMDSQLIC